MDRDFPAISSHPSSPAMAPPPSVPSPAEPEALIRHRIDLVYGSALRQTRNPHLAADVTQAVFLIYQKKSPQFGAGTIVTAWLLRTTRFTCLAALQRERRRRNHEQRASAMRQESIQPEAAEAEWTGVIDAALDQLRSADRELIAAVYFEGMSHQQIAARLGIGEAAAHKRVQRAVARLRRVFRKKGRGEITAVAAVAALVIAAKPAAAPAAVTHAVAACLTGGTVPAGVSLLAKGTMVMMKVIKAKVAAIFFAAAAATGALGAIAYQTARAQQSATPPMLAAPDPVPAPAASPATSNAPEFRPIHTLTIFSDGVDHDNVAVLDAATALTPPKDLHKSEFSSYKWIEDLNGDLIFETRPDFQALFGFGMAVIPANAHDFDRARASQLVNYLLHVQPAVPALLPAQRLPATFYIRTRSGGVGVLQVMSLLNDNSAVQFRYKLLTPAARDKAAAEVCVQSILPELQNQMRAFATAVKSAPSQTARNAARDLARVLMSLEQSTVGTPWAKRTRLASLAAQAIPELPDSESADQLIKAVGAMSILLDSAPAEMRVVAGEATATKPTALENGEIPAANVP